MVRIPNDKLEIKRIIVILLSMAVIMGLLSALGGCTSKSKEAAKETAARFDKSHEYNCDYPLINPTYTDDGKYIKFDQLMVLNRHDVVTKRQYVRFYSFSDNVKSIEGDIVTFDTVWYELGKAVNVKNIEFTPEDTSKFREYKEDNIMDELILF